MELSLRIAGKQHKVDLANAVDISIPMRFNGDQPNTYGVERAASSAYRVGSFVGDVREGGSCNFESYTLVPHCNGTHTECIGHITGKRISIHEQIQDALIPATLISVPITTANQTVETYTPALQEDDHVVTGEQLEKALTGITESFLEALVLRTLPNDSSKCGLDYTQSPAPFFTHAAMHIIKQLGVKHLLVDFPSLDRLHDEGLLSNHRIYWNVASKSVEPSPESNMYFSITEMVYVPDEVQDGSYLLNLQFPSFVSDAAPSKPVLFPVHIID